MSYEKRNLRVFLSSSMAEFYALRSAVKQELDKLGIPNFVFEKEGASDQAPGDKFRAVVQGASVYIGVFGKGLGNYTREEYELARAHKIACHLYVQHLDDEDRSEELKGFLMSLNGVSDVPTIYYFRAADELVTQIKKDLWTWIDRLVGRETLDKDQIDITYNLPILCNRDPQEIQFETQVTAFFQIQSSRPLLLMLPGPVEERHGHYLDRVRLWSLEEYLKKAGIRGGKKIIQFRKSPCAMTSPTHFRSEILGLLQEQDTGDDGSIVDHIKRTRLKALLIVVRLLASDCEGNPRKTLHLIAEYLAGFPDTTSSVLVSVVVCLEEDRNLSKTQGWWNRVFGSRRATKGAMGGFEQAMTEIQQQYQDNSQVRVENLPPLTSPKKGDVRRWLDHELVKPSVRHVLERETEIEAIFQGRDSLPMDTLYLKLMDLLKKGAGK